MALMLTVFITYNLWKLVLNKPKHRNLPHFVMVTSFSLPNFIELLKPKKILLMLSSSKQQ